MKDKIKSLAEDAINDKISIMDAIKEFHRLKKSDPKAFCTALRRSHKGGSSVDRFITLANPIVTTDEQELKLTGKGRTLMGFDHYPDKIKLKRLRKEFIEYKDAHRD